MTAAWSQWRPLSGGKTPEHGLLAPTDFIPLAEETGRLGGRPSHVLGVTATADGAETSAQVDLLRRLRCDAAQGHYWSPPLPADQLAMLLAAPGRLRLCSRIAEAETGLPE
ncbi:MAG TPA: hypothetical protein VMV09_06030 [Candidatus Saccharimonadales bacterium]|nr:hypothetical protein [Candidatus Saccharimonadales bacterium]